MHGWYETGVFTDVAPFVSSALEVFSDNEVIFFVFEEKKVVAFILLVGLGVLLKLVKYWET